MMDTELKLQAFETIFDELSAGIADAVESMKSGKDSQLEISTTLAEMLALMEARKTTPLTDLIAAIKGLRIQSSAVSVNVSPTPIQNNVTPVVQILERVQPGDYELTVTYDKHDRIEKARLTRITT